MVKGGSGGKQRLVEFPKTKEWNYFPDTNNNDVTTYYKLLPVQERIKRNENAFKSVLDESCEAKHIVSVNDKEKKKEELIVFLI